MANILKSSLIILTCLNYSKEKNLTGRFARWYLTIKKFNCTFKYLPVRVNVVVDVLSRNVIASATTEISNFSAAQLRKEQLNDPV